MESFDSPRAGQKKTLNLSHGTERAKDAVIVRVRAYLDSRATRGEYMEAPRHICAAVWQGPCISRAAQEGDDGTNDVVVSDVIRTNELQVWFLAEYLVDAPLVHADGQVSG
jgi:hypothetical protein